ncbi:MAG: TolC family protein [Bacteroidales bacterium]|nr:TolC family protein [Bacteroidales bacterium]
MKMLFLYLLILFFSSVLHAQIRDLNYYLEQAKNNSPLIHQKTNDNEIISLDLKQVKSVLSKPEVSLEGNILFAPIVSHNNSSNRFEWVSNEAKNYTGYDLASTDGGQYQAGILIQQPLLNNSVFRKYSNKAGISQEINNNNITLTIHELEQLVGYQYILCLIAKTQAQNNLSLLNQIDDQSIVLKKLVEHALYKQRDLMLLQIERSNLETEYKTAQAGYKNNLYDLNLICGINDTTLVDIQKNNFELIPETPVTSKFLLSYNLDSLNLLAEQSIYEQKYRPQLFWFTNAGLNAVYLPKFNRLGFSTGLSLSWTIFDGHQRELQQQKTTIELNTLDFEKQYFIKQTDIQKQKIVNQILSLEQREALTKDQIKQYDVLISTYQAELSLGEISVMDLKNLFKDMALKKQELLMLEMERQTLINSYNYWNF